MTDKLLALNVPTDFLAHVEFARQALTPRSASQGSFAMLDDTLDRWAEQRYEKCLPHLGEGHYVSVCKRLFEIECRFVALQKTVDQSVPVAPLWRKYSNLGKVVERHKVDQFESDYVVQSLGFEDASEVPHSMNDFRNASSLAEKAIIADLITEDFRNTIEEIAKHFHYKRRMFGRGASRTYSLVYAVLALSYEFEAHNTHGKVAGVTLAADGSGHEGVFLRFVLSFLVRVNTGDRRLRLTDGLNERVRKIAQKRNVDKELIALLDRSTVDTDVMLNFMERADALKA